MLSATLNKRRALVAAAALSVVLAACGQDDDPAIDVPGDDPPADAPDAEPEDEAADSEGTQTDIEFAQGMIPHHQGAIEMAELVEGRTERQELIDLAQEIIEVQDEELELLRGMLDRMGAEEMGMDAMDGMDHGDIGMMDDDEMEQLRDLEGDEFDGRFVEAMIEHHQGAIDMAERVLTAGQDEEVAELAQLVIDAQEAEIEQMREWLDEWGLA